MTFPAVLMVLGGALALLSLYLRVIRPFNQLRESLRRLAERDFRPVLLESRRGVFRETSSYVQRISEHLKQLDQQILDEGFSLRGILSSMIEGVFITDRSQRIRLVNESLQRMLDLRVSPINRTVIEVFHNHELQKAIEKTLYDGTTRRIETSVEVAGPVGYTTRHLEVYAGGLNPKPKMRPLGAVVVFHDITNVKSLEAVRREFVANVSHEFRTPLAIINGYIETLLDGALHDPALSEKFLQIMARNGERLTMLIEDLLTISRMEHRSVQMNFRQTSVKDVLERVLSQLEPALEQRRARISVDWEANSERAEVDPARLEQVFVNLLENALRHCPGEGVVVKVTARRQDDNLVIVFSDDGPGIPLEDQPHIFERFYRVHKDRSRVGGGTGLGLSIVKHIVLAHRGTVAVSSRPGAGASFIVKLPIVRREDSEPAGAGR